MTREPTTTSLFEAGVLAGAFTRPARQTFGTPPERRSPMMVGLWLCKLTSSPIGVRLEYDPH